MKTRKIIVSSIVFAGLFALLVPTIDAAWQLGETIKIATSTSGAFSASAQKPVASIDDVAYSSIDKAISDGILDIYFQDSVLTEYSGSSVSVIKTSSTAWIDPDIINYSYATTNTEYEPSSSFSNGSPINAGYYKEKVNFVGSSSELTINVRIAPKVLHVKTSSIIEVTYDSSKRTSANIISNITNLSFTDNVSTQSTYNFSDYVVVGIDNGMYYYPNESIINSHSSLYNGFRNSCVEKGFLANPQSGVTNVVGSTYAITLASTNSNYEIANRGILKYKTAIVGSTRYTVEDAIANAGSNIISFEGNSSSATTYVATSFCALDPSESPYTSLSHTLTGNMVVNYQNSTSIDFKNSSSDSGGNVYSALIIPSNVTLNVPSGKSLVINATIGYKQPNTSVTLVRGVILNEGRINVNGTLKSYGYLKGNGIVDCKSGSEIYEVIRTFDWCGGNTATKCYNKSCLPINSWSIHNISCTAKINYGSKLYAQYYGLDGVSPCPLILSNSTSDNCVFVISNSNSYILKKAAPAAANPTDNTLSLINGSNQINGQKDIIELYGTFVDSQLSMNVYITVKTSTSVACPIGFMSIYLKNADEEGNSYASTLTLSKSSFIFLPGTSITVDSGTKVKANSNVNVVFETAAHINTNATQSSSFGKYCVDKTDAFMMLNGEFETASKVAGLIKTSVSGAVFKTGSSYGTMTFYSLYNGVGASSKGNMAYQISNMYGYGYIGDTTQYRDFQKSQTYTSTGTSFSGSAGSVTGSTLYGTYKANGIEQTSACLLPETLITMADGSKKMVKDIVAGDMVKVFNHETGQYDVAPMTFNDYDPASLVNVINLEFSNGSKVGVVSEHGFFDLDTMRYEYITEENYQGFVGHRFYVDGGGIATLDKAFIEEKYTEVYSPTSFFHFDYFVEDMLSIPGGITGLFNIFEYADNLQYDQEKYYQDIETYGLFTYEDLAPLGVTEIMFEAYAGKYLKVALGKGILTEEYLMYLIERYGGFTEE